MKRQSGYALIVILLLLALVLISLSVALPPVFHQAQREKEEELIFRGQQYQRAIGRFYRKFGRYPQKVEELIRTNDRSFLRRPFPDPMTPDGKWRIIRVGAAGQLIGSKQQPKVPAQQPQPRGPQREQPARGPSQDSGSTSSMGSAGVGAPIIGVASNSDKLSIRVYDGYTRYDHWEFIYDPAKEALRAPAGTTPAPETGSGDKSKTKPKSSS
ncbi:MAG: hypothetical protein ACRD4D_00365 [Candidatus Acidiferrales bacterium]